MLLLGKAKQYLKETEGVNILLVPFIIEELSQGFAICCNKRSFRNSTKVLAAELGKDKIRVNCVFWGDFYRNKPKSWFI